MIFKNNVPCEHRCPVCLNKFTHKVEWGKEIFKWEWQEPCYIYFVYSHLACPKCMEWPLMSEPQEGP